MAEISRINMISTIEKVSGDLGNFLANNYFSNPLMDESENTIYEHSFNFLNFYQKSQFFLFFF